MTLSLTKWIILIISAAIAVTDVALVTFEGWEATISWYLWSESHLFPGIAFVFGLLMGHLFFSQNYPK
jgi:hypothetical protein